MCERIRNAARAVHRFQHRLRQLVAPRRAPAVEHQGECLPFTRGTEQDQAVTGLDIRPDLFVAEGALVHPEIARVALADHGFTQEHGRDRNVGFLDQVEQRVLQPEAMKLYAGDDDGLPCVINHVGRLAESLPEGFGVADVLRFLGPV